MLDSSHPLHVPRYETRLLVLQPTPYCNIDCSYCYLPERDNRSRMSMSTLRAAIRSVQEAQLNCGHMMALWHAGEPLSLPSSYYREAFAIVREEQLPDAPIRLGIQTNAISVTPELCKLFCDYDVSVGVSLDGPPDLHDAKRRTRNGKGTHAQTVRGLRMLQQHGLKPHVIAVVTRDTLARPREFYHFFRDLGVTSLSLNFEEVEGVHKITSLNAPGVIAASRAFVSELYDLAITDPAVYIRELGDVFRTLTRHGIRSSPLNSPFSIITVDWRGGYTMFSPELLTLRDGTQDDFIFGNVHDGPVTRALENPKFHAVYAAITAGVHECQRTCAYFEGCGGGSASNKLAEHGRFDATETLTCRLNVKTVMDVIVQKYEAEMDAGLFWVKHDRREI